MRSATLRTMRSCDARFADQYGIVLGSGGRDLDGAANFLVAADHGIELALARRGGEVLRAYFLSAS
jgi:hypothetical protein